MKNGSNEKNGLKVKASAALALVKCMYYNVSHESGQRGHVMPGGHRSF